MAPTQVELEEARQKLLTSRFREVKGMRAVRARTAAEAARQAPGAQSFPVSHLQVGGRLTEIIQLLCMYSVESL